MIRLLESCTKGWIANARTCTIILAFLLPPSLSACGRSEKPVRYAIGSVRTALGLTGRSIVELPAGSCILLHFPPAPQPPTSSISDIILRSDNGEYEDRMLPFGNTSTFNCVTFALGDLIDLGPGDWLEPLARSSTFYTVPADIVLASYCEPVLQLSAEEVDWEALSNGDVLQEGDIFCFCEQVAGRGRVYSHMGKIWRRESESLLVSKLGVGPIVKTSLQLCAEKFHVDSIVVYRRK